MAYQPASLAYLVSSGPMKNPVLNKKGENTLGTTIKVVLWPLHTHTHVYPSHTHTSMHTYIPVGENTEKSYIAVRSQAVSFFSRGSNLINLCSDFTSSSLS